jgi:hypothetical protein
VHFSWPFSPGYFTRKRRRDSSLAVANDKERSITVVTTGKNLTAGKAQARQSGNGGNGRTGFWLKLATGVAIVGCATALTFGGLRSNEKAQEPQVAPAEQIAPGGVVGSRERQIFMEWNTVLPTAGAGTSFNAPPYRDWASILFWEQNQLPELPVPSPLGCHHGELAPCDR